MTSERWNEFTNKSEPAPDVDAFLQDLDALCRKHSLAIEHEDTQGSFIIVRNGKYDLIQGASFHP